MNFTDVTHTYPCSFLAAPALNTLTHFVQNLLIKTYITTHLQRGRKLAKEYLLSCDSHPQ